MDFVPSENAIDFGERTIRNGVPLKEWISAWMDLPKEDRVDLRSFKFSYGSPFRPLPIGAQLGDPNAHVRHIRNGTRSLIFTTTPLSLDTIYAYELIPITSDTIGRYIMDLAVARGNPIELGHTSGDKVALLFKNPRGIWQLSYFIENGPTGHDEDRERPERLAFQAYSAGYRILTTGMLDAMAVNFDPELLKKMSSPKSMQGISTAPTIPATTVQKCLRKKTAGAIRKCLRRR